MFLLFRGPVPSSIGPSPLGVAPCGDYLCPGLCGRGGQEGRVEIDKLAESITI